MENNLTIRTDRIPTRLQLPVALGPQASEFTPFGGSNNFPIQSGVACFASVDTLGSIRPLAQAAQVRADVVAQEVLEGEFSSRVGALRARARMKASPVRRYALPEYRDLVAMGAPIIPLLLREISAGRLTFMNAALAEVTGEWPSRAAPPGDIEAQAATWLDWARARGIQY